MIGILFQEDQQYLEDRPRSISREETRAQKAYLFALLNGFREKQADLEYQDFNQFPKTCKFQQPLYRLCQNNESRVSF